MDVQSGRVGLNSAGFSAVHFVNFKATPLADDYQLAPVPEDAAVEQQNNNANRTVSTWQVSTAFDQATLKDAYQLDDSHKTGLTWTRLQAEPGGVTNLARIQGPSPESNTVFARLVISSEKPQTRGLGFGYSDAVQVFVNDVLVYQGHNTYESRDYRYLGTIGLFDKVYLPLKRGDNEIWFAVSEAFGGWGILAQMDESEGITIKQ